MMKIRHTAVMMVLLIGAVLHLGAQEWDMFERELQEKNAGVETIKCSFVQTRRLSVLDRDVEKGGEFCFVRRGGMLLAFDDGDYIKMTERWFEMRNMGNTSRMKVSANPMLRNLSSILSASVTGDFEKVNGMFASEIRLDGDEWTVVLTPKGATGGNKVAEMVICFERGTMSLNRLEVMEASGDFTKYRFFDKRFNCQMDSTVFEL